MTRRLVKFNGGFAEILDNMGRPQYSNETGKMYICKLIGPQENLTPRQIADGQIPCAMVFERERGFQGVFVEPGMTEFFAK